MAVPETRCKDGSLQARQGIQRLHKYAMFCLCHAEISGTASRKTRCRDGVTGIVFVLPAYSHQYT